MVRKTTALPGDVKLIGHTKQFPEPMHSPAIRGPQGQQSFYGAWNHVTCLHIRNKSNDGKFKYRGTPMSELDRHGDVS